MIRRLRRGLKLLQSQDIADLLIGHVHDVVIGQGRIRHKERIDFLLALYGVVFAVASLSVEGFPEAVLA